VNDEIVHPTVPLQPDGLEVPAVASAKLRLKPRGLPRSANVRWSR